MVSAKRFESKSSENWFNNYVKKIYNLVFNRFLLKILFHKKGVFLKRVDN